MELLERTNRILDKSQKTTSKTLDGFRRLVQVATAVVLAFVMMAWFIDHPALQSNTKNPLLAGLSVICMAYLVALELAHGRTGVIMFLIISGTASAGISGGYAACWLHHHM
jgi:hypothetical protein